MERGLRREGERGEGGRERCVRECVLQCTCIV